MFSLFINLSFILFMSINVKYSSGFCKSISKKYEPKYYMTHANARSTLKILIQANYRIVEKCETLALKKRGMAFSFSPTDRFKSENDSLKNCLVFSCPEVDNTTSLKIDLRYDYYSVFAGPIPPTNATCVESVGIFVYHFMKMNYSMARNSCLNFGGHLADIATESRTNKLSEHFSRLFVGFGHREIYVGMDDLEVEGQFARSNGELLTCTSYRAWAPGNPKSRSEKRSCVTLDTKKMWHAVKCAKKFYFLCEIYPGAWFDYYDYEDIYIDYDK